MAFASLQREIYANSDLRLMCHKSCMTRPKQGRSFATATVAPTPRPVAAAYPALEAPPTRTVSSTQLCRASSHADTPGAPGASSLTSVDSYLGRGPYGAVPLPPLTFRVTPDRDAAPLSCTLRLVVPQAAASVGSSPPRWPLLVLSAGFLLHSDLYGSYGTHLASWGMAVALYDVPELVDDQVMVLAIRSILDVCTTDPRVSAHVDPRILLLAGHSRGGKLSVLAAAADSRVSGLALLDPVDVTPMTPPGPGYPSALSAMRQVSRPPRSTPTLILGAARNGDVVPAASNYTRFAAACSGPCWSLELSGAGHLQFLDAQIDLLRTFVSGGPTPDEAVRRVSKAALAAWALELAVPLARGGPLVGTEERLRTTANLLKRTATLSSALSGFEVLTSVNTRSATTATPAAGAAATARGAGTDRGFSVSNSGVRQSGTIETATASAASASASGSSAAASVGAETPSGAAGHRGDPGGAAAAGPGGGGGGSRRTGSGAWRYEQLVTMRARELKALLVAAGVDCSDCFEKEDLIRRVLERC